MPDIEFIAKDVLLLKEGKLIQNGAPGDLCKEIEGKVYEILTEQENLSEIRDSSHIVNITHENGRLCVRVLSETAPRWEHKTVLPTLEDLYLYRFGE